MKKGFDPLKEIAAALVVTAIIYLFYKSLFVLILLPLILWLCHKYMKKENEKKAKRSLNSQFKDMLISMTAALRAGYSVENALKEAQQEMELTFGADSEICAELNIMLNQLKVGVTAEEVFFDFAGRTGIEDINTFASVFRIAVRSGGDMAAIMKKTASDIAAKVDMRNEIDVLISAKRLEQNIMMIMPAAIIVYIDLSSDGLLDPLYGNVTGVLIMTVCLGLYALAWYMGHKITEIEV